MRPLLLSILLLLSSSIIYAQNSLQAELDSIRNYTYQKQDSLLTIFKTISAQKDTTTNPLVKKELQDRLHNLNKAVELCWEGKLQSEFAFVQRNPASPLSLDILYYELWRPEALKYYDTLDLLFKHLASVLQNGAKGKQMREALSNCKNSEVGKIAPDFTVKDINGLTLSLSAFRTKSYVLLDFWASWCVPCREDFPYLKQAYKMYQPKGLEIISVSIDQDLEQWRKAIQKDNIIMWRHFAVKGSRPPITSLYFVIGVPLKVLIDKQGQIVARWLGGGEENEEKMKETFQKVFEQPN